LNDISILSDENISGCVMRNNKNGNEVSSRRLLSDYTALLDKFLIQFELEKKEHVGNELLLESLRKMKLKKRYMQKLKQAELRLETAGIKSDKFYRGRIFLYQSRDAFEKEFMPDIESDTGQIINASLDNYFVISKLFRFHEFFSKQYINKEKVNYDWTFYKEIMNYIENNLYYIKNNHPEIFLRYRMLCLLLNPGDKNIIDECIEYIQDIYLKNKRLYSRYYLDIINLCSLLVNLGDSFYNEKIFHIAQNMEKNNSWNTFDIIGYVHAKVITESAIQLNQYNWAENFINNIAEKIEPVYKSSLTNLMLAKIYFFKRSYDASMIYQSKVHYEDFVFYTDAKGLEARIEFEKEDFQRALESISLLRKYLKNHKNIPDSWRNSYNRFAEFLISIIRIREQEDSSSKEDIKLFKMENDIKNSEYLIYARDWLLKKISELK
jgi:hypothetical protein